MAQPFPDPLAAKDPSTRSSRHQRVTAAAVFVSLVCCGATSCTRTQIALSATAIGVAVAGTAVGVTYAVKHHNHTVRGCVYAEAGVLKLRTSDAKVYELKGDAASLKSGETVTLHGSKVKKAKGDSAPDQIFTVQKLNNDDGPCSTSGAASPSPAR